jgi:competence protein ComEC
MNPGGFDYEKWLFTERILATGYIRKSEQLNKRLDEAPWWSINHWRQLIHEKIQDNVINKSSAAVLSALTVAVRNSLDDQQWQLLRQTGTSHLVAISGLHIAVVAGFAFFPVMLIWRLFPNLNERVPLRIVGGVLGVLFALVYAMLAGFTLPTQRALLMVVIGMWGLVSRRNYDASSILALALIGVLIIDPLAAMTISFWLSFLAVTLILIFLKRQIQKPRFVIIKLQLVLSIAMLPLTLLFFGTASLTSPVANLFAIPWVSLVVVPLSLIALILMLFSTVLSDQLLSVSAVSIDYLFKGLAYLAESPLANIHPAEIPSVHLIVAFTGLLFFLLPKGFPARWLGIVLIVPAFLFNPEKPQQGSFSYTLLDVGQGMASVVQTAEHTLVYDTGTRFSDSFDVGKLVLVPFLRAKGVDEVDRLIVSHEDNDHRGGARYLVDTLKVNNILSSDTSILSGNSVVACVKGMQWQWEGVDFEMLSPPEKYPENDNNRSCVLRVSNQYHSLLLTADIQALSEQKLIENYPDKLISEVVTVPHHGSKTSSSIEFIESVSPKIGLIPAGYRSRFGHPKPEIVERYETAGVKLLDTVSDGAIRLDFPADATASKIHSYRRQKSGFWSR